MKPASFPRMSNQIWTLSNETEAKRRKRTKADGKPRLAQKHARDWLRLHPFFYHGTLEGLSDQSERDKFNREVGQANARLEHAMRGTADGKGGGRPALRAGGWKRLTLQTRIQMLRRYEELCVRFHFYEAADKVNKEFQNVFGEELTRKQLENLHAQFGKALKHLNETGTLPQ
tara:strand:- start:747 stop:1265 length:519 start_codon:yes stop_codon:yes gene_type:complete